MNVRLTPEFKKFIQSKVERGTHLSASDMVLDALRMMKERDELLTSRKKEIQRQVAEGYESLSRGEGIDGEEAFRLLDERHKTFNSAQQGSR